MFISSFISESFCLARNNDKTLKHSEDSVLVPPALYVFHASTGPRIALNQSQFIKLNPVLFYLVYKSL